MKRFFGYSGPKIYEILHLPRLSKATLVFLKKEEKKKPEGERPVLFAIESYLTGIVTSLDSFGSLGQVPRVLAREWVCVSLWRGGRFSQRLRKGSSNVNSNCGWAPPHETPWALRQGFMPRVKRGGFVFQRSVNPARV